MRWREVFSERMARPEFFGARGQPYEKIWEDITVDKAAETLDELASMSAELSKTGMSFPNDARSMLKWEDHVVSHRLQPQS